MDAVIVMAGSARRMGKNINKVFLLLGDKLVIDYSIDLLKKYCEKIILVIRESDISYVKPYLDDKVSYVLGGSERYLSVRNGINATSSDYVLIHDGARPFITEEDIVDLLNNLNDYDALFMALNENNTLYKVGNNLEMLNRDEIILAATPQIIKRSLYDEAINNLKNIPTDEISTLLQYNPKLKYYYRINNNNFKITRDIDYNLAKLVVLND